MVGGLDAVAILKGLHRAQLMAPMTRLRGNYLGLADGLCVIETMDYDEERLHPVDGIGREVSVSLACCSFRRPSTCNLPVELPAWRACSDGRLTSWGMAASVSTGSPRSFCRPNVRARLKPFLRPIQGWRM